MAGTGQCLHKRAQLLVSAQTTCEDYCVFENRGLMLLLSSHLVSAYAEDLHTSEVQRSCAHRAKKSGWSWQFGPWNMRSIV